MNVFLFTYAKVEYVILVLLLLLLLLLLLCKEKNHVKRVIHNE